MPITLDGSNGITTPTYGGADTSEYLVPVTQFKNRIINGDMRIDQRNAGASISVGSSPVYPVDRFQARIAQGSGHTAQRSAVAPAGFVNSVLITVGTGASPTSGQVSIFNQQIEGFNMADLGWGTADAKPITLSFKVRSSVTGIFSVAVSNSGLDRSYVATFVINSANTFEDKTVTIAGDTTGTWLKDNGIGAFVFFDLGSGTDREATAGSWGAGWKTRTSGSVRLAATSGATFYITGVQLEVGSTATSFDYRPYTTELQLCQRYYWRSVASDAYTIFGTGFVTSSTNTQIFATLPVTMRASPTLNYSTCRLGDGSYPNVTSVGTFRGGLNSWGSEVVASGGGLTTGRGCIIGASNSTSAYIDASAEL